MLNSNRNRYYYNCLICGRYVLRSYQFQHDIECQTQQKLFDKAEGILDYKCKICGQIVNEFNRKEHILLHQSNKNEIINSNISNQDSNINHNQDNNDNIDLSTISLGRNNHNIIFRHQNNNGNNRRNRRSSMDNNSIRRYSVIPSSSSDDSDSEEKDYLKDLYNISNSSNFITIKIKDPKKLSENKKQCLICLERFIKGQDCIILPCLHIFHSSCIKKWISIKNFCPLCKQKIFPKKKHKK